MSDIQTFAKNLGHMKFYKYIANFIDAQRYFGLVIDGAGFMTGLAKASLKVFGKQICKKEQMCNWEKRPLRLSQQHYGALDAYIMIELIEELAILGEKKGHFNTKINSQI
jgi:ribonuclease D